MMKQNRNTRLTTLPATICLLVAGEQQTHVTLEHGVTPVLVISGSGKLASLTGYSPDFAAKAESPWDENEIRNSRAVMTHGLGPCFKADGKKWIRVACPN
jgi:hypothetical protein